MTESGVQIRVSLKRDRDTQTHRGMFVKNISGKIQDTGKSAIAVASKE